MLLYPTTLITKFIPAFFTEGQQQQGLNISQTNLTVASGISASISRNQVRLSIHVGKKMNHLNNIFIEISILVSKLAQCGEYRLAADEPLIKPGYLAALLSDG